MQSNFIINTNPKSTILMGITKPLFMISPIAITTQDTIQTKIIRSSHLRPHFPMVFSPTIVLPSTTSDVIKSKKDNCILPTTLTRTTIHLIKIVAKLISKSFDIFFGSKTRHVRPPDLTPHPSTDSITNIRRKANVGI